MACLFASGASLALKRSGAVLTGYPLAVACWARLSITNNYHQLMSLCTGDAVESYARFSLYAAGDNPNAPCSAAVQGTGALSFEAAFSRGSNGTGYTANAWHHFAGCFAGATSRTAYLDGYAGTTATTSITPDIGSGMTYLGAEHYGAPNNVDYGNGNATIAEAAIWDLTDLGTDAASRTAAFAAIVAALAKGRRPLTYATGLVAYWPLGGLYGQTVLDRWKSRYDLTASVSPTYTDHCRVIYGGSPMVGMPVATVAGNRRRRLLIAGAA